MRRLGTLVIGGVLAVGAATCAAWPANGATAPATPIHQVVVIYQENHSFNNVLGDLCVVDHRCTASIGPVTLADGSTVAQSVASDLVRLVHHDILSQVEAVDGGKMDGWANIIGCGSNASYACLSYYTPDQVPAISALARQFVIADQTFQSNNAPSWAAHLALATGGTLDGFVGDQPVPTPGVKKGPGWGCNSNYSANWTSPAGQTSLQPSCVPDYALGLPNGGTFQPSAVTYVPTIMDKLTKGGYSWRLYSPTANTPGYNWSICPSFAECLDSNQARHMASTNRIIADASQGTLPSFSIVTPYRPSSQHNGTSMAAGDNWISQVVGSIENGPQWSSTAIFITWDDCGCFYDPIPPPPGEGIRAPMVIVSPYARAGFTDSTQADVVGSILAFVEHNYHLASLTQVDASAYDYSGSFDFTQQPLKPQLLPRQVPATPVSSTPATGDDDST
jgi:phospholipase C